MKAILVRYRGPTHTRGSAFWARAEGVPALRWAYDHALSADGNAARAAVALCERQGWFGHITGGQLPNGDRAFVFNPAADVLARLTAPGVGLVLPKDVADALSFPLGETVCVVRRPAAALGSIVR